MCFITTFVNMIPRTSWIYRTFGSSHTFQLFLFHIFFYIKALFHIIHIFGTLNEHCEYFCKVFVKVPQSAYFHASYCTHCLHSEQQSVKTEWIQSQIKSTSHRFMRILQSWLLHSSRLREALINFFVKRYSKTNTERA